MKKANGPVDRIAIALGIGLLAVSTGCIGVVDDDGEYDGDQVVVEPEADVILFGGGFDGRRDEHDSGRRNEHDFSRRGSESRATAHPQARETPRHETRESPHPAPGGHEKER